MVAKLKVCDIKLKLTLRSVEYGEGPVSQGDQHTAFNVPACQGGGGGETGLQILRNANYTRNFSNLTKSVTVTYTRLSTESLSLMEWRHFFQFPTAEWM